MLFNAKLLYEAIAESYSIRRIQTERNAKSRLLDRIDTTENQFFSLTSYNDSNNKYEYYDPLKTDNSFKQSPFKKKKKQYENLYYITSEEQRRAIFSRQLKPTPFQRNQAKSNFIKRTVLIKQFLNDTSDIDGTILQNISLPYVKANKKSNEEKSFHFNRKKNKNKITLNKTTKRANLFLNLKNLEYHENIMRKKKDKI